MRVMSWNCRGLGNPSTIPQLKESLRLFKLKVIFLCETKRRKDFVSNICRMVGWGDRWKAIDSVSRSGELWIG